GALPAADHQRHRHGVHLRLAGPRPRPHLPVDEHRQLRPGRDGDVLDVRGVAAHGERLAHLGVDRRHARPV
ncbi:MAG: ABC transporter, permease protein 1 (cluster 4, leucine/isoleucine/valine/benzoate), partial [uncultured Acidimicrobiales bacterium]